MDAAARTVVLDPYASSTVALSLSAGVVRNPSPIQGVPNAPVASTWIGPAVTPINTQATPGASPTTGLTKAGDAAATLTTPTDSTAPYQALNTKVWLFDNSGGSTNATVEFNGTATAAAHSAQVQAYAVAGTPTLSIAAAGAVNITGSSYARFGMTVTASAGDKLRITCPAGAICRFTAVMLETGSINNPFTSTARVAGSVLIPSSSALMTPAQGAVAMLCRAGSTSAILANAPYGRLFWWGVNDARLALNIQATQLQLISDSGPNDTAHAPLVLASGDFFFVIARWTPGFISLSVNGAPFVADVARTAVPAISASTFEPGGSANSEWPACDYPWFATLNGRPSNADAAALYARFGQSGKPKPTLRQIMQLVPGAHPTELWDGRGTTAQRRVAA